METEALEELGLTRNESVVYVTLLDLGKATISQIAEKTRMHRRTIYDCLERLEDQGLVSFVIEGGTRFFMPAKPQKLIEIIEEKRSKIDNVLPRLLEISNRPNVRNEVAVYKGKEGLKSIMEDIAKAKPRVLYSLTSAGKAPQVLPFYIDQFHKRRIKLGIALKIIFGRNEQAIKRANELKKLRLTHVKIIDTAYTIPISTWIYDNKIIFMLWESEIGIVVESKEMFDTFKNYFNFIWKIAK